MTTPLEPRGPLGYPITRAQLMAAPERLTIRTPLAPLPGATMPTSSILDQFRPYEPSWVRPPRTTWTDRLGGHYGLVGPFLATRGKSS
jgi:hypothetical protein